MTIMKRDRHAPESTESWPEDRIDRVFRAALRDFFSGGAVLDRFTESIVNPLHVEEFVEGSECVVRAELPGIDPDKDIDLTLAGGFLRLRAQREERKEEERPDSYRSEFRYGAFRRTIRLPQGVSESDVRASYRDGILEVRMPMPEPANRAIKVPVEHS